MFCTKCKQELIPKKNGVKVKIEGYTGYFRSDYYECPCGTKLVAGFGNEILSEPGKIDYEVGTKSEE